VKDTAVAVKDGTVEAAGHAGNLANAAKEGTYGLTDHVADWMRPEAKPMPRPITARYCYSALQDILCYRQPMPGWEHRLVAYQPGTADPPLPAMMQPLPTHEVDVNMLPKNRAANAQPVFATPPSEISAAEKAADPQPAASVDATHEQLPDPVMAPQL